MPLTLFRLVEARLPLCCSRVGLGRQPRTECRRRGSRPRSSCLQDQAGACPSEDTREEQGGPPLSHSFSGRAQPWPQERQPHLLGGSWGPQGSPVSGGQHPPGESQTREGPPPDAGPPLRNKGNVTCDNGALICLMSPDRPGTRARSSGTPGSHRRCPAQVFTRGGSWQAGPWAGARHTHRAAIRFCRNGGVGEAGEALARRPR